MKNLTKIQKVTLLLIVLYVVWEIMVRIWESVQSPAGAIIRADLILIYPVLIIMIIISLAQMVIRFAKRS